MPYTPTFFVNDQLPPISAGQLNKLGTQHQQAVLDALAAAPGVITTQVNTPGSALANAIGAIAQTAVEAIVPAGISTKAFPEIQMYDGTDTDVSALLNEKMFNVYEHCIIDGNFRVGDQALNWSPGFKPGTDSQEWKDKPLTRVTMTPGSRLRVKGASGISRVGQWKFAGFVSPAGTERGKRTVVVEDGSLFSVGDWIMVASGDRLTRISDFNFTGAIRQVLEITDNTLVLDKVFQRSMNTPARVNYFAKVRTAGVEGNTIPVDRAETFRVGDTVRLLEWPRTPLATGRTVTAYDTTPGAHTITFDGASVTTTTSQYIVKTGDSGGDSSKLTEIYSPGAYVMKLMIAPPFTLTMGDGSVIEGRGFKNPTIDGANNTLLRFELCRDVNIVGDGTIGYHPRGAIVLTNCVGGSIGVTVRDIWNLTEPGGGGSGYLINSEGATRDNQVTVAAKLYRGRHGYTTNVGPNVRFSVSDFNNFNNPNLSLRTKYQVRATSGPTLGGAGESEDVTVGPGEVAYMLAQGLDTHRAGFNITFILWSIHDNNGGVQTRADATRIIGLGPIDGCTSSGLVINSSVDPRYPAILDSVKVANARGDGVDNFSIAGKTIAYNCEASGNSIGDGGYGVDVLPGSAGTRFINFRCDNMGAMVRFQSTGTVFKDPDIDFSTVPKVFVESGDGTTGDNKIIYSDQPFGIPGDNETRYYSSKFVNRNLTQNVAAPTRQYASYVYLHDGLVTSLSVWIETAASSGGTANIALFRLDPLTAKFPATNTIFAEVTVTTTSTGLRLGTLTTPFDTQGGGWYGIAIRADGSSFVARGGALQQNEAHPDPEQLSFTSGQGLFKTPASPGVWSSWGSGVSTQATAPVLMVGMKLR